MDNGEWMMRAARQQQAMQQQAINLYNLAQYTGPHLTQQAQAWTGAPTPGERPEPEDTTGLKMLEEFLAKRKGERDGKQRK
jgi:hypothetical protein